MSDLVIRISPKHVLSLRGGLTVSKTYGLRSSRLSLPATRRRRAGGFPLRPLDPVTEGRAGSPLSPYFNPPCQPRRGQPRSFPFRSALPLAPFAVPISARASLRHRSGQATLQAVCSTCRLCSHRSCKPHGDRDLTCMPLQATPSPSRLPGPVAGPPPARTSGFIGMPSTAF